MFGSPLLWHHAKVLNLPLFALNTLFLMYSISIHLKIIIVNSSWSIVNMQKHPALYRVFYLFINSRILVNLVSDVHIYHYLILAGLDLRSAPATAPAYGIGSIHWNGLAG